MTYFCDSPNNLIYVGYLIPSKFIDLCKVYTIFKKGDQKTISNSIKKSERYLYETIYYGGNRSLYYDTNLSFYGKVTLYEERSKTLYLKVGTSIFLHIGLVYSYFKNEGWNKKHFLVYVITNYGDRVEIYRTQTENNKSKNYCPDVWYVESNIKDQRVSLLHMNEDEIKKRYEHLSEKL
jgi:hypothetical protein